MENLIIKKIYIADNGDVFIETNSYYKEVSNEEFVNLIAEGLKIYETGLQEIDGIAEPFERIEYCKYVEGGQFPSYYTENGEFIGHLGIHILPKYSVFQNFILIRTNNKKVAQKAMKEFEYQQNLYKGV